MDSLFIVLTNAEKCKRYREKLTKEGKKEIRGIMSYPDLEIKIKLDAQKLTEAHERLGGKS